MPWVAANRSCELRGRAVPRADGLHLGVRAVCDDRRSAWRAGGPWGTLSTPGNLEVGSIPLGDVFDRTLRGARRGRGRAWDALYADLAPLVLGYLRAQAVPDPEDVCAETFLQVVRDLHRFEGDERHFRSWVLTIAHHRATDARRRQGRRPSDPVPDQDLERALPPVRTEGEVLTRLGTEEVVALLDQLGDDQREVLLLRLLGGLSTAEIAQATGRTREGVKALQKRGIARLRQHLGVTREATVSPNGSSPAAPSERTTPASDGPAADGTPRVVDVTTLAPDAAAPGSGRTDDTGARPDQAATIDVTTPPASLARTANRDAQPNPGPPPPDPEGR